MKGQFRKVIVTTKYDKSSLVIVIKWLVYPSPD